MSRNQRKINVNSEDEESLFDFLDDEQTADRTEPEDSPGQSSAKKRRTSQKGKGPDQSLPVIRKPVCISQTGPLTPPKPGDPVEPPPRLTDPVRLTDKPRQRNVAAEPDLSDIDDFTQDTSLDLDLGEDDWPSSENWVDSYDRPAQVRYDESESSGLRILGYALGALLIAGGASSALYSVTPVRQWADRTFANFTDGLDTASRETVTAQNNGESVAIVQGTQAGSEIARAGDVAAPPVSPGNVADAPRSLNAQFRETLDGLERLLAQGAFEEATNILKTMDRVVYGYGAPEFKQIEEQIAAQSEGGLPATDAELALANTQEASVAEQLRVQQESALIEAQRVAEQVRQREVELETAEAARAAAEEAQRVAALEAERQAALETQRQAALEAERLAALEAQRQAALEEERLAALEAQRQAALEAERQAALEAQRQAALEAERQAALEAQRQAALEAERQAALEAQRQAALEAERQAALEAQRQEELESQRLAEAQAAAEEAARLEAQQAELARQSAQRTEDEQLRADRIAQEQARQEQLEIARLERQRTDEQLAAGEASASAGSTPVPVEESVQDIAARQRAAARARRIAQASEREVLDTEVLNAEILEREAAERELQTRLSENPQASEPENTVALANQTQPEPSSKRISDGDLQLVYGLFSQLQSAIENRDINEVLRLTETSGARIQQVMQMFENNVTIDAQLRNVSTLDSTGEIQGTLQITRLERVDGSVTGPPLNLSLVRLSSVRQGDGWSRIRW